MKKLKRYAPWIIAAGSVVFAVGVQRFYAGKILLEIPTFNLNGKMQMLLPSIDKPMIYKLKTGEELALYTVKALEAGIKAV